MGRKRKRTRKTSSDFNSDDSDIPTTLTIPVKKQTYSLRPRKAQRFTEDLVAKDSSGSDFEDELELARTPKSLRNNDTDKASTETNSIDYDDLIQAGVVVNENHIDYEKVIEKTEIQVQKRTPSPVQTKKRPGRKPKPVNDTEKPISEAQESDPHHSLDAEESNVEEVVQPVVSDNAPEPSEKDSEDVDNPGVPAVEENGRVEGENGALETDASALSSTNTESAVEVTNESPEMTLQEMKNKYWAGISQSMDGDYFVECDQQIAVLKEKAPKAKFHYLIVPKENVRGLVELTSRHLEMIKRLYETSKKVTQYPQHKNCTFKIGFNAQPSMFIYNQKFLWLHLHVISDDMQSKDLVLKKHWNAIHSSVFVSPQDVIQQLQENGKVQVPTLDKCKDILNGDIKCHKCDFVTPKFSAIKKHIVKEHKS